jgi:rod shape-determining protein MreC
MVVTTSEGVAGVVDQVYRHYARFMLISASQSRMGVKVLRRESRAVGVLTGLGPNRSLLQAEYFGRDDDVQPGDMLVTSGIGGKYPAGLCIGTVSSVEADVTGLQKLAQIEPAADLSHPDRVFVILQEDVKRRIEKEIAEEAGEAKP